MPVLIAAQPVAHIWNLCYGYRRNVVRKPGAGRSHVSNQQLSLF